MIPKNRMRAIRSYGTVGVPAGNRRHYPEAGDVTLAGAGRPGAHLTPPQGVIVS